MSELKDSDLERRREELLRQIESFHADRQLWKDGMRTARRTADEPEHEPRAAPATAPEPVAAPDALTLAALELERSARREAEERLQGTTETLAEVESAVAERDARVARIEEELESFRGEAAALEARNEELVAQLAELVMRLSQPAQAEAPEPAPAPELAPGPEPTPEPTVAPQPDAAPVPALSPPAVVPTPAGAPPAPIHHRGGPSWSGSVLLVAFLTSGVAWILAARAPGELGLDDAFQIAGIALIAGLAIGVPVYLARLFLYHLRKGVRGLAGVMMVLLFRVLGIAAVAWIARWAIERFA